MTQQLPCVCMYTHFFCRFSSSPPFVFLKRKKTNTPSSSQVLSHWCRQILSSSKSRRQPISWPSRWRLSGTRPSPLGWAEARLRRVRCLSDPSPHLQPHQLDAWPWHRPLTQEQKQSWWRWSLWCLCWGSCPEVPLWCLRTGLHDRTWDCSGPGALPGSSARQGPQPSWNWGRRG